MADEYDIRAMKPSDWPAVARIYADGIGTGHATFESDVPDWDQWDASHLPTCRLVVEQAGEIIAWAALAPTSMREVYRGVAEASIYVDETAREKGVGSALMASLIECSEGQGFWTLQAGIFPENEGSVLLFQRHGFRTVGTRERMGAGNGRWRDVLLLERRSNVVGA